ncbi:ATP-binding protein [Ammoniphilus sp. 3BR4]|uniref:ATP-binding protein n=1 Tax=Ammoniphilus sp. 3BR4 TaxID=3158265 RepID=UPI0034661C31
MIETVRENEVLQQKMHRAEKNHVIGELAASFAHEIRNPLTVVQGFTQILKRELQAEEHHKYTDLMLVELKRTEFIINEYLSLAKPCNERATKVKITQLLQNLKDILNMYAIQKNIIIQENIEESLFVQGVPDKLMQVFMNIMKNAIEATPADGTLFISAYRVESQVVIRIRDTGKGMTKEEMLRLGNPFYSTKENGTGLGLMVSYRLVELMNGTIEVQSEKEKGTQFTICFPSWDDESDNGFNLAEVTI